MRMLFFGIGIDACTGFLQTIIFIFFLICLPAAVLAQAPLPDFKATLSGWQATFDKAAGRLSRGES